MMKNNSTVQFAEDNNTVKLMEKIPISIKNTIWFSHDELAIFKKSRKQQEEQETSSNDNGDTKTTSGGIVDKERREAQHRFVQSVLSQQLEHKQNGISDPRGLSILSKSLSKLARQRAIQVAAENAIDVHGNNNDQDEQKQRGPRRMISQRRLLSRPHSSRRLSIHAISA